MIVKAKACRSNKNHNDLEYLIEWFIMLALKKYITVSFNKKKLNNFFTEKYSMKRAYFSAGIL